MARAGSSSRFVSVNLSKSYGQAPSPLPGHGSSAAGSPSTGYRARSQNGGMVVLSRPGRSQSSVSSTSSRTSKLAIPRPVNLPSLRSEHAGNDPTLAIVGTLGSAGWSKQQVLSSPADSTDTRHTIPADSASVRSTSLNAESSWSSPATRAKAEGKDMKQTFLYQPGAPYHQTSMARSSLYTPPGSRNSNAVNLFVTQHPPGEKAMVVRGEDFPTLQAAVRPLAVPALQRQRDMHHKHWDKQHELKDQHVKLQQLSQQQHTKVDMPQLERYDVPQLQPSRPQQALPKHPSFAEEQSHDVRRTAEKRSIKFNGPSPLIRLTHTSDWGDDERETLQGAHVHGLLQVDRSEFGRPPNSSQLSESWALDYKIVTNTARPVSRNGFSSANERDQRDLRDNNRSGTRDMGPSNGASKALSNQQLDVDSWDDLTSWNRGSARNDNTKQHWSLNRKDGSSNSDARFGNSSRSYNSRTNGVTRDMHTSASRDVDLPYRGENTGADKFGRDVRSQNGSNGLEVNSGKQGLDDRQGDRFRKSIAAHQYGRSDISSAGCMHGGARNVLSGLDYGREKRVSVLFGQDPFTDEPRSSKHAQSLVFETFVGVSGFEAKICKRRKDEPPNFHDPARELFEAELERVQKMQEQERQRLAEEHERAIELARKEEEERERRAREEELLRLKLEEEAREAAARARREEEEAARKAEEIRRAKEEEKRMIIMEEERRKESARKKLLELEQRIALRESGRDVSMGSLERARKEDPVLQDEHRRLHRFDKFDKQDYGLSRGGLPLQTSLRTELVDSSQPMPLESPLRRPFDSRGEEGFVADRFRVVQMKRRETLDDGPEIYSALKSYDQRDIPSHELDHRTFSARALTRSFREGASQSSSKAYGQERTPADFSSRKERWQSGSGERLLGGHLSAGNSASHMDSEIDRDDDGWWSRDNSRKFQDGQRLSSPPLFPYSNGGDNNFPSFGRIRQSLPKQPRVLPPIFGRASSQKQIIQSESMQAVFPVHNHGSSEDLRKDGVDYSSQEMPLARKVDSADRPPIETPSPDRTEMIAPLNHTLKVLHESEGGLKNGSQAFNEDISQPDEIDQLSEQLSDLTESEDQSREDEKQLAVDMQVGDAVAYEDEDDAWVVQGTSQDMGEEICAKEEQGRETVQDELENQDWESLKIHEDAKSTSEHGNHEEKTLDSTWECQPVEDEGDGGVDDYEGAADSQLAVAQSLAPKTETQDKRKVDGFDIQEVLKGGSVESQNVSPSANALNYVQVEQSEGHNRIQSFMQQFQQPFSFMAVPLPQSTTVNGVPLHPPMLPSMRNLQTQQELPYHLQMGLIHNASPLMPNAIQIGSIQMPLQVHPQIPSVAHQHQHPPLFQFGQICQFSQPVPAMQPSFQMHHPMGQPPAPQVHQTDFVPTRESSQSSKLNDALKELDEVPVDLSACTTTSLGGPGDSLLGGSPISKKHMDQNSGSSLSTAAQMMVHSGESRPNEFSTPGGKSNVGANQDTLVGKITSGRRRNSNGRTYGIYGRGRGRPYSGKDAFSGPYSVTETLPESSAKAAAPNRTYRQNFRRAEYKIRKPPVASVESEVSLDQEDEYVSDIVCSDASVKLVGTKSFTADDTLDSRCYSPGFGKTDSQLTEAASSLQCAQIAFETTDIIQAGIGGVSTSSNQTQGAIRKFKSDELGETTLHGRLAFAFEQQGTDVHTDKDDFIEVRSKRQLLKEQREIRDKAKIEDFKAKEQIARDEQKVIGKIALREEASVQAPSQHPAERWSVPNADASNEGRHGKHPQSVIGSNLQQFCSSPDSSGSSIAANEPMVSKSVLYQPVAVTAHNNNANEHAFGHQYSSTATLNGAWGVQKSAQEVVSFTQIQLEEAMKPFDFSHTSSQMGSIAVSATGLEPGIPLASSSADKVSAPNKASVSMSGPISSLLAGEKIQFGAVTSPTVVSSSNHPPSPFVGAIGSQFGSDKANFISHSSTHARDDCRQESRGTFLSSKIATRVEEDMNGQFVDAEAEALAAASAVAVAAISNDEAANHHSDANAALGGLPGVDGIQAGVIQAPSKSFDNSTIAAALPADLSVDATAAPHQSSVPIHSGTSEIMLQQVPTRTSPFPCLEMGTVLGGPVFAYGPREDAALSTFEPGLAGLGRGWQHRYSNTSDSFYGAPPPFINPAGLPSIQGHPHMLVYTNPFTQVSQFGQLGVSFMGTTYHPTGKQPDWTHTPYTPSPTSLNQSGGDVNTGRPPAMDVQHNAAASHALQAIPAAGCSVLPVPAPISVFDPNFSSPFQAHWSRAPVPQFPNYHTPRPAPGLNLHPLPGELGLFSQSMQVSGNLQQLSETSVSHITVDATPAAAGVHFPKELGFAYLATSNNSADLKVLSNRGHSREGEEVPGGTLQQPQSMVGNPNLASVSSQNEPILRSQDFTNNQLLSSQEFRNSELEDSYAQTSGLDGQRAPGHHPTTMQSPINSSASQQTQGRGGLGADWQGSNQRRGSSRTLSTVLPGERVAASSPMSKQIYVARPATPAD